MATNEIKLLKQQIEKLEAKDFDLSAWKKFTIVFLARIFGDDSPKIKQIEKIESDYSSWSLRDTSGSSSNVNKSKKLAREILEAAIAEIEIFGGLRKRCTILPEHISIITAPSLAATARN